MKSLIRLHQLLLIIAILSGCYAPDLRDCTVTCSGATDCASGQVCGSDGYCAAEGVAGSCGNAFDAAVDSPPSVMLRVMVMGNGQVDVVGAGSCGQSGPPDCVMQVPKNGRVQATAVTHDASKPFDKWDSMTCAGQGPTCTFTAFLATTTIAAKFR
jgi:hypothetical protein